MSDSEMLFTTSSIPHIATLTLRKGKGRKGEEEYAKGKLQ
jgi:hypothetical protein